VPATSTTVSSTQRPSSEQLSGGKLKITIESMIEICRDHSANVKRWRDGQMALRWCAAGMVEAGKQFRKVNGFLHLPALRAALDDYVERGVTPIDYNKEDAA
jgi:putative transposase